MKISGRHYRTGKGIGLTLKGDAISSVGPGRGSATVAPGLVDLQVNGFRGLDFNTLPAADDVAGRVTRELWSQGVTTYFATVITNSPEGVEGCVRALARGCERDADARAAIAGIHLEGPFISPEDGPRGAHDRTHVRPPEGGLFRRWQEASGGRIRLITMSPEWPGSTAFIEQCVASGVTVSIGHTAATPEQVRSAVAAGASMSTHLGNGSHLMMARHPNYVLEQMADDRLAATFIVDGFHLPDSFLKVALRVKGGLAMLVSDAVYLAGSPPGTYDTHIGGKVVLTAEGQLHLAGNPRLMAGSVGSLLRGVEHLVRAGLSEEAEAWEMASTRPAKRMNLAMGKGLVRGAPADVVELSREKGRIELIRTWKSGKKVWEKS